MADQQSRRLGRNTLGDLDREMPLQGRRVHFVGIGGIGMSAIAHLVLELKAVVSGSDLCEGPATRSLASHGCKVHIGHDAGHVHDAELVVRSSAVPETNPEIAAALRRHVPVISRARMLARLADRYRVVAVAGSHGKTTTTWLVARLLIEAHYDPSVMVGGMVGELGGNYRLGAGPYFVAEVDESDGSLLEFRPDYSVVTNLDLEHVDRYPDLAALQDMFRRYLHRTRPDGCVILGADCPAALAVRDAWEGHYLTYGFAEGADFRGGDLRPDATGSTLDVQRPGDLLRDLRVSLPGRHNAQNALAAVAVASALGIPDDALRAALAHVEGVARRMELKGAAGGVSVYDDYAHHPTEIRAALDGAREMAGGRLVGVFQPHRYTRTLHLAERFGECFDQLDHLVILPIYAAGEEPIAGVGAERIVEAVRERGQVDCAGLKHWDEARRHLLDALRPGDTLLTIGAGNVVQLGEQLLEALKQREGS